VIKLLGIAGSLRAGSLCRAVLSTLSGLELPGTRVDQFDLAEIPPFNDDRDGSDPPACVAEMRRAIANANGLLLISPEYNHGMSGVLKNALDWASRPTALAALKAKPVLVMTVSPAITGGVRAHQQLNETLLATQSRLVAGRQIVIGQAHEKIVDGSLVDLPTLDFITQRIQDLMRVCTGADSA
jgi:chromate reductase, NAD(P)H dehydrogenase (quinone)